uniref:Ubs_34 putative toxin n=1 Tax=Unedogemmula bisaya TaxID=746885 RepID=A0A098LWH7_UNEBI
MARLIFLCELMIFFLVVVCFTNSQDSSAPDDPPRPECGPICRMYCFTGFVKDKNGCEICECNPNDNDDLVAPTMLLYIITSNPSEPVCGLHACEKLCLNGFLTDSRGCPTCQCKPCPQIKCSRPCPYGYKKNSRGCQTCTCNESIWEAPLLLPMRLKRKTTPHH